MHSLHDSYLHVLAMYWLLAILYRVKGSLLCIAILDQTKNLNVVIIKSHDDVVLETSLTFLLCLNSYFIILLYRYEICNLIFRTIAALFLLTRRLRLVFF